MKNTSDQHQVPALVHRDPLSHPADQVHGLLYPPGAKKQTSQTHVCICMRACTSPGDSNADKKNLEHPLRYMGRGGNSKLHWKDLSLLPPPLFA